MIRWNVDPFSEGTHVLFIGFCRGNLVTSCQPEDSRRESDVVDLKYRSPMITIF